MAKTKISEYSTTNSSNSDIEGINIAEGCAPSGINNAIREVMVHLKNWQTNASGDGATFANLVVQGTGAFTGAVTMSAGATLSGTNTLSGANIISGNINSSGTNTFSGSQVISGNINSSGTNTFSGATALSSATITGGTITGITDIAVADGGTGRSTLTANNVILGNGTSAVNFVAPGTSGNVLTSNGTTWTSASAGSLGVGQTWQNMTSSRSIGVTYTNTTGKTISFSVNFSTTTNGINYTYAYVDGNLIQSQVNQGGTGRYAGAIAIVPPGSTYSCSGGGDAAYYDSWWELR